MCCHCASLHVMCLACASLHIVPLQNRRHTCSYPHTIVPGFLFTLFQRVAGLHVLFRQRHHVGNGPGWHSFALGGCGVSLRVIAHCLPLSCVTHSVPCRTVSKGTARSLPHLRRMSLDDLLGAICLHPLDGESSWPVSLIPMLSALRACLWHNLHNWHYLTPSAELCQQF